MSHNQFFMGNTFYLADNGYYKRISGGTSIYMHRVVYEYHNGKISDGYEIHHRDGDRGNNQITNLEIMKRSDHRSHHMENMTDDLRQRLRQNMLDKAIPAAAIWHGTPDGIKWHKKHYSKTKDKLHEKVIRDCYQCSSSHETNRKTGSTFCKNSCKSAYRRKLGLDDVELTCEFCGSTFKRNKYAKPRTCSRSCSNRLRAREKRQA